MFRVATVALLNCYSALFFKGATVATLKKKFRVREAVGGCFFVCLLFKFNFRESIGDALIGTKQ